MNSMLSITGFNPLKLYLQNISSFDYKNYFNPFKILALKNIIFKILIDQRILKKQTPVLF